MLHILIVHKYATLKELKEYYTIEDVLDLYESCLVNLYNKHEVNNLAQQGGLK